MKQIHNKMITQKSRLMSHVKIYGSLLLLSIVGMNQAVAQTALPLEIHQDKTLYNYQSVRGVPTSGTVGDPVGSDGRVPSPNAQELIGLTRNPPTANQFSGFISWGGLANPDPALTSNLDVQRSYTGNAPLIGLPRGPKDSDNPTVVLQRAQVGAPFLNRPVSFLFGGIISPPDEDETGTKLDDSVSPDTYWLGEPHLFSSEQTDGHTAKGYYYSPHARAVFAIQPGPIEIRWRKATPHDVSPVVTVSGTVTQGTAVNVTVSATSLAIAKGTEITFSGGGVLKLTADAATGATTLTGDLTVADLSDSEQGMDKLTWFESVGNYYQLYKKRYIVSGSAAKSPRKIYWNQAGFQGPQVSIPASSIGELKIVYNSSFPERVPKSEGIPMQETGAESSGDGIDLSLPDGTNVSVPGGGQTVYTKTLWHQRDSLMALNAEGRVFVELLGDLREDGATRYHLGFEIVDVFKTSTPADVTIELGDRVTAWDPEEQKDDSHLTPQPNLNITGETFVFQAGGANVVYYATRETRNLNDYQIQWMEEGLEGILWPSRHARYKFVWPDNPARYSHYIRPPVETKQHASLTAVPMPNENSPTIQYQDPLDGERAFFTDSNAFYTYLNEDYPVHRALLRFSSGSDYFFERVFSWLDTNIKDGTTLGKSALNSNQWLPSHDLTIWGNADSSITGSVYNASALDANGDSAPVNQLNSGFLENTLRTTPRYLSQTVYVGDRILAPAGELGNNGDDYWAGYIITDPGDNNKLNGKVIPFNPNAYIDPIANGFEASNNGAIIPVNADPSNNVMEVYWYRKNEADVSKGFQPIYWPSVLGRYTIQWPSSPDEIVLASNDGSGALSSLQAKGSIYVQNNSTLAGYNPNEEHALMLAGQAYALRDDLNDTSASSYSSAPYVLVEYTESDSRLAMKAFKVLREKPEAGIIFDYITEAGQMLQAPMPLPLLAKPVDLTSAGRVNYNTEPPSPGIEGDAPRNSSGVKVPAPAGYSHYGQFTYEDRKGNHWVYRGLHAGPPVLEAGTYDGSSFGAPAAAKAKVGEAFSYTLHASRRAASLKMAVSADSTDTLPDWLSINSLTLEGTPSGADIKTSNLKLVLTPSDGTDAINVTLSITVSADEDAVGQAAMNLNYSDGSVTKNVGNRPPSLASLPTAENSFKMRFYYRTLEGFYWPGMSVQPAVDTIVPYLLPLDETGAPVGVASSKLADSLEIVYRPVWPAATKVLGLSETLTEAKRGLPAVRGQSSVKVLYQQSIAAAVTSGEAAASAILHDPTREKTYAFGQPGGLETIPPSIKTYAYQGKLYFPNLPPHLSQRLFYDPNRGSDGELVFKGSFVDEVVGEDYLLLNVLDGDELALVKDLCPSTDTSNRTKWNTAIDGLTTSLETFYEPVTSPGQWLSNTGSAVVTGLSGDSTPVPSAVGIGDLAAITHDDTAVDSYALSASGPGTGYVTLITNDGNEPSKAGLPISIHIIRVGQPMYRGEVKVLYSSNPLDEKVTFQHTADLGGKFGDFDYEWMIQPPVNGADPKIYYATSDSDYDANYPKKLAAGWTPLENGSGLGINRYTLGGSGIQTLSDNWIIMRYRPNLTSHPGYGDTDGNGTLSDDEKEAAWSEWTEPQLAEGWIKRVLAGINPFNQRSGDMFSNSVNTEGSMLTQAGGRWEGDIALNLDNINDHGLIEIY